MALEIVNREVERGESDEVGAGLLLCPEMHVAVKLYMRFVCEVVYKVCVYEDVLGAQSREPHHAGWTWLHLSLTLALMLGCRILLWVSHGISQYSGLHLLQVAWDTYPGTYGVRSFRSLHQQQPK